MKIDIDKLYDEQKCEFSFNGQRLEYMNRASFRLAIKQDRKEYNQMQWHDLRNILIKIVDTQQKLYGDATELHLAMSSLAEEANNILQELPRWEEK